MPHNAPEAIPRRRPGQPTQVALSAEQATAAHAEPGPGKAASTPNENVKSGTPKEPVASVEEVKAAPASTPKEPVASVEEVKEAPASHSSRAWAAVKPVFTPSLSNTVDFAESKAWETTAATEADAEDWVKNFKFDSLISPLLQSALTPSTFMVFPLLYLALAAVIAAIHNRPTSHGFLATLTADAKYAAITNAITVGVTLFPIGFGLILCQLLKTTARWRAERGTQLLTLEQILASKSFGSALQAPAKFRRINFVAIGLIILWAASPITTQALQRIFTIGQGPTPTTHLTLQVLDLLNGDGIYDIASSQSIYSPQSTLYTSSLLVPEALVNLVRTDIYGNPKIPILSYVQSAMAPDKDGWYSIGSNLSAIDNASPGGAQTSWSSLLGVPISGIPPNTSTGSVYSSFNFSTGYWKLDCGPFSVVHNESTPYSDSNCLSLSGFSSNTCEAGSLIDSFGIGATSTVNKTTGLSSIIFTSRTYQTPPQYVSTTCAWDVLGVDLETSCVGKSCAVSRIRASSHNPDPTSFMAYLRNLLVDMAFFNPSFPSVITGGSSLLENWLVNPNKPILDQTLASPPQGGYVNISKVPLDIFSARFSVALNTFYQVGLGADTYVASLPDRFDANDILNVLPATASVHTVRPVYQCSWGWLVVLLVSCAVCIICILVEMYLATKVLGPDILGYVSTVTHGGTVAAPAEAVGGSAIDGPQRVRLLAHAKVRLQDVQPGEPVGRIALVPGDGAPLIKGRKYE